MGPISEDRDGQYRAKANGERHKEALQSFRTKSLTGPIRATPRPRGNPSSAVPERRTSGKARTNGDDSILEGVALSR